MINRHRHALVRHHRPWSLAALGCALFFNRTGGGPHEMPRGCCETACAIRRWRSCRPCGPRKVDLARGHGRAACLPAYGQLGGSSTDCGGCSPKTVRYAIISGARRRFMVCFGYSGLEAKPCTASNQRRLRPFSIVFRPSSAGQAGELFAELGRVETSSRCSQP